MSQRKAKRFEAPNPNARTEPLDVMSPAAIFLRNYKSFELQEIADVGALMLFLDASIENRLIQGWSVSRTIEGGAICSYTPVAANPSCEFRAEEVVQAMKAAVGAIVVTLQSEMPSA